ncbi:leukocyte elastase inhibitor-like [Gouania willdenowi]|uniref:Serpin B6 n=1 Tax=Gouania willdenowi TaxID=441366 RepID=A0A8C5H7M0_GOUWI|nr:leukocyte elastase inhibitor-like [Gouania willdenowi]XP_028290127.1 leukocyte elastase inhibitor-like [Gouania willdenowi]
MTSSVPMTKANTSFCLAMLNKLSEEKKNANVFFSPFSVSAALAMVMMGAAGTTAAQMSKVLGLTESDQLQTWSNSPFQSLLQTRSQTRMKIRSQMQLQQRSRVPGYLSKVLKSDSEKEDAQSGEENVENGKEDIQTGKEEVPSGDDAVHAKFAELWSEMCKADAPYTLSLANKLYGDKATEFLESFLEKSKKYYNAELESVDFQNNAEQARTDINKWVQEATQDKIKDLLAEGAVDTMSRLVLVNAIYFNGKWRKQFETTDTVDAEFRLNKTDKKSVKMMCLTSEFNTRSVPALNCEVLEIPYEGEDLSMIIILPNDIKDDSTGLEKLEKELTCEKLMEWTRPDVSKSEIKVKLPRFKMEETYDLKGFLTSMGMVDAFDQSKSDFSEMSSSKDLTLSKLVHKAFVDVNEEGTEAAAATGATMSVTSISEEKKEFIVDHPFLFFICQKSSKSVVFAGRCCCPE